MATDAMVFDIATLKEMYIDSCRRHGVRPNTAILCGFFTAAAKRSCNDLCSLEIFLNRLKDCEFPPLLDVCAAIENSEIEAVDIRNAPSCLVNGEYALSLMRAFSRKLRVVQLQDSSFGKDLLRELCQRGLTCLELDLRSSRLRKLNMAGEFMQLRTLNLDFSSLLSVFQEDCFTGMPNLICLSMCGTKVSNLWTTSAALAKLPSLVELQFQKWLCCNDTGSSSVSSGGESYTQLEVGQQQSCSSNGAPSIDISEHSDIKSATEEAFSNMFFSNKIVRNREVQSMTEDSSDDSELGFSSQLQEFAHADILSNLFPGENQHVNRPNEVPFGTLWNEKGVSLLDSFTGHIEDTGLKYISCHSSPICFEKHYRDYMIASLPHLKILDNLPIRKIDRERADVTFSQYFEYLPYKRKHKENVVSILHKREIKDSRLPHSKNDKSLYACRSSQYLFTRSLCAAKVGSSAWPILHPLSVSGCDSRDGSRSFRPRQFEYHPSISRLMVFGTLNGEVVVINHENGKTVSYVPSVGAMNSVLGLCWLKKYPSKLIAGSDSGSLKLYDIEHIPPTGICSGAGSVTFNDFEQLTSVHVNSTDELFLASGYSTNVALYDINSGKLMQVFTDMHREHINVVKFSHHSPSIFATSSFDHDVKLWDLRQKPIRPCYTASSSRGNVMVCFSPDDHYLLASAVDNEVRQLLAVDGRLHLSFEIAATGSSQNYTRSYYMNGRDYIISGSCDEHLVRVCCAQTGRRLRDISLEGIGSGNSMYVQSLRGDPFRNFNMSILAAYLRPNSKSEIFKVNLLASGGHTKEHFHGRLSRPGNRMGG